ncbi:pyrokinin-1 receptor-like [Anopheles marshallii]|uniref:pyrokinin-1 receptor-like n=1 Tax=Anopheles marshallii TaxID=1521116 RepID=UPI00237C0F86|nr:pyrokinin-1 receptor-like [Anopheles marshallii]
MISYSSFDHQNQGLRGSGQWDSISNRTVHRLLTQRRILTNTQAAIKDVDGTINLTFSQEEHISIGLNVSFNLTVGEAEPGNADAVNGSANGTIPFEIRDALWIVIPISIIYSTIFVIGMLGNIITCIVISRNKSMHTATNYYLFSLAISDLLLLITGVPQDIYHTWYRFPYPFGNTVCKIVSFASESSVNATVLTITAFTVERYVAICKPFLSHTMSKLSRAVRFVITIWVIAFSLAIPQALSMQIDTQFRMCTVRHEQTKHLFFISTVLVFVCPMSVITILYILIWLQLRRSKVVRCGTYRSSSVRLKRSIFKRSAQRTVVTLHCDQNVSPLHHYSESVLASSMQHPRLTDSLSTPSSPYLHYAKSYPASPVRKHRRSEEAAKESVMSLARPSHHHLHHHHRRKQSLLPSQYCSTGSSSVGFREGSSSTSVTDSHQKLEQQLSGASEDGRINYSTRAHYNSTRHVVKMLVAVVIAFFLCWAPFHAQRLMAVYANDHNQNAAIRTAFEILTCVSGILYYISTCINPVLYNIMSHKFREAFKECIVALKFK